MPRVHLAHRSRGRIRLRIPEKRKDLPYFLGLYEELRRIPDIGDVRVNPLTGSVLLQFPPESAGPVFGSLYGIGLLSPDTEERSGTGMPRRMEAFFSGHQGRATDMHTLLLVISIALAIHQICRGMLLVPALSLLWLAYDLWGSRKKGPALIRAVTGAPDTPSGR